MNLVGKEFPAARDDEHGMIVLSCVAGGSREFNDTVIVNPYAIDGNVPLHARGPRSETSSRPGLARVLPTAVQLQ